MQSGAVRFISILIGMMQMMISLRRIESKDNDEHDAGNIIKCIKHTQFQFQLQPMCYYRKFLFEDLKRKNRRSKTVFEVKFSSHK